MRKRIDTMKRELVTDNSHRDIHKRGFIYETPDNGKTIYRKPSSYCDVSGVKIGEGEQLHFGFKEDEVNERAAPRHKIAIHQHGWTRLASDKMEDILDKLNTIETQVREVRTSLLEL
jgi:hypothetical protein